MKVGDIIQDYEFPDDRGIVLKIATDGACYVLAFYNAQASWLPKNYMETCKVVG